jgi:hypothetical protein
MKKDTKKNPAPIAPVDAGTENASGLKFTSPSASPKAGTLVKKKGAQAADPYTQAKPSRTKTIAAGARGGATYGVRVGFSRSTAPEASATQSNGRLFSSAVNRSRVNFQSGSADLD